MKCSSACLAIDCVPIMLESLFGFCKIIVLAATPVAAFPYYFTLAFSFPLFSSQGYFPGASPRKALPHLCGAGGLNVDQST